MTILNEEFDDNFNGFFNEYQDLEVEQMSSVDNVKGAADAVMIAYQNANKWLDIIKEFLFTDLGCVFFSSYIHTLAHTMPVRFDKFGDILHTVDMKVPYPATNYIPEEPQSIDDTFRLVFMILGAIKDSLNTFIEVTDKEYHGMACSAEALLNDIENEYVPLFKMQKAWIASGQDIVKFDKWMNQFVKNKDDLLESLNAEAKEELTEAEDMEQKVFKQAEKIAARYDDIQ